MGVEGAFLEFGFWSWVLGGKGRIRDRPSGSIGYI